MKNLPGEKFERKMAKERAEQNGTAKGREKEKDLPDVYGYKRG